MKFPLCPIWKISSSSAYVDKKCRCEVCKSTKNFQIKNADPNKRCYRRHVLCPKYNISANSAYVKGCRCKTCRRSQRRYQKQRRDIKLKPYRDSTRIRRNIRIFMKNIHGRLLERKTKFPICPITHKSCSYAYFDLKCRCPTCHTYISIKRKQYYRSDRVKKIKNDPEYKLKRLSKYLMKKYNLSIEEYQVLLKKAKNRCMICHTTNPNFTQGSRFAIDHDHITGKIRGLLCNDCNIGIGKFKDSIEFLKYAILYLQKSIL